MADSVRANLELMAAGIDIETSYEEFKVQRGSWLPAATADGDFTIIDPNIASPFANAQRQFTWGVTGRQLLYSAQAHGGLRATRDRYRSIEWDYNSARLDTMLAAGESYLNVLRAKNNEGVQRDNLKLTRKNLSLAETRYTIGVSGREEVFRWQTQIAESRSDVIQASATRNQAEIELNRILNRPLEGPFQTPPESEVRKRSSRKRSPRSQSTSKTRGRSRSSGSSWRSMRFETRPRSRASTRPSRRAWRS